MSDKFSNKKDNTSVKSEFVPIQVKFSKKLKAKFKIYCVSNNTNTTDLLTDMINKVVKKNDKN